MQTAILHQHKIDPWRSRQRMMHGLEARGIKDRSVLEAMGNVPRHLFVPDVLQHKAYDDNPLPIGYEQTISQPYTVAFMTQMLELAKGMRILEVGTGSGYQTAILAYLGCTIFTLERLRSIFLATKARLQKLGFQNIHAFCADGTIGLPAAAPYDRIIVTAGGPEVPRPLLEQLEYDGILIIPVGDKPKTQRLIRLHKQQNGIFSEDLGPVTFVNLIGKHAWQS